MKSQKIWVRVVPKKNSDLWLRWEFSKLGHGTKQQWSNTENELTLPETNSSHLPGCHPKRKLVFQPSIFRCHVSFREGNLVMIYEVSLSMVETAAEGSHCLYRVVVVLMVLAVVEKRNYTGMQSSSLRQAQKQRDVCRHMYLYIYI